MNNTPEKDNVYSLPAITPAQDLQSYRSDPYSINVDREDGEGLDLRKIGGILWRRKATVLVISIMIFIAACIQIMMTTSVYQASVKIEVNKNSSNVLGYNVDARGNDDYREAIDETQFELFKSQTLAKKVIDDLGIESDFQDEVIGKPFFADQLDKMKELIWGEDQDGLKAAKKVGEYPKELQLLSDMTVEPIENTRLVMLHYQHKDPEMAAEIANSIANNFSSMSLDKRLESVSYAKDFLNEQLALAKSGLEESERELIKYTKEQNIMSTGTNDSQTLSSAKFTDLFQTLSKAEKDQIEARARYEQSKGSAGGLRTIDSESLQVMKRNLAELESEYQAVMKGAHSDNNSNVQSLRRTLADLESQYKAALQGGYTTRGSNVQSLKRALADLESQYKANIQGGYTSQGSNVQSLRRKLADLESRSKAASQGSHSFDNSNLQTLKSTLANLESEYRSNQENTAVQQLKSGLRQLQTEYQEKIQIYKPAFPSMIALKQKINETNQQINQETAVFKQYQLQQINELKKQIRAEQSQAGRGLQQEIDEVRSQIQAEQSQTNRGLQQQINEIRSQIAKEQNSTARALLQQINEIKAQIGREQALTKTGLEERIAELRRQIEKEIQNIQTTTAFDLKAGYLAAKEKEDEFRARLEAQKGDLLNVRDKSIRLNTLKREVETNRNMYEGLLQRIKEVGVAGGAISNNIAIIDPAIVPFAAISPNVGKNLTKGVLLGLALGLGLAFLLEFMDDRITGIEELEKLTGFPVLGIIPRSKQKDDKALALMSQSAPRSFFAEAFRTLRTNLMFSTQNGLPKTLSILSPRASEGKTTSSINIATIFAQAGNTVLLVDADLRNPSIHKRLQLDNNKGLTNFLTSQGHVESVTQSCAIPDVYVITAGPVSPNPVELLASERLERLLALAEDGVFDLVIFDLAPVLGLSDALVVSNQTEATLLVTESGQSKRKTVTGALKRLKHARTNIIGILSTKTRQSGDSYNYEYYSYGADDKLLNAA